MKKVNKKEIITFCIILAITCIIFIPFLKGHYATDTYQVINTGYRNYAINKSLNDGRVIMALIGIIASKINIPINTYVITTLFLALTISSISVCTVKNIIKKYKEPKNTIQEIILISISYITIFNFMYLEDMYFIDSITMATSVLAYILAANILIEKKKKYIIKSLIFTIIGIICYQGTIGMFFAFVILFTVLQNKDNTKQILIDLIKSGCIAAISVILNIISVKIIGKVLGLEQTRLGSIFDIFSNIKIILLKTPTVLQKTCNLFPQNLFIIFLTILTFIVIIYKIKNMKTEKYIISEYILIILITILGSSVTYLLTLTSFYTGRLRNALGAVIGIGLLFIFTETNIFEKIKSKNILSIFTTITLISYIIINIVNYESIMIEHKKVNKLEEMEVNEIEQYIENYEKETGKKVTKIAKLLKVGEYKKIYFPNTKHQNVLTHNAIRTMWAADGVINFYTNRNLHTANDISDEEYKKVENTEKGYLCIDDILYVMIYMN